MHAASVEHNCARCSDRSHQRVLEPAAVNLEGWDRREPMGPELDAPAQIAVAAIREKVPEAELEQVLTAQD